MENKKYDKIEFLLITRQLDTAFPNTTKAIYLNSSYKLSGNFIIITTYDMERTPEETNKTSVTIYNLENISSFRTY